MTSPSRIATLTLDDGRSVAVVSERSPSRSYGRRFVILFQDALHELASRVRSGPTLRVMIELTAMLDFTTYKTVNQARVGRSLAMTQSSVSGAMRELVALGLLERIGSGAHVQWRLSSNFGWKGTPEQWHAAQRAKSHPAGKATSPPIQSIAAECELWKFQTELAAAACDGKLCGSPARPRRCPL